MEWNLFKRMSHMSFVHACLWLLKAVFVPDCSSIGPGRSMLAQQDMRFVKQLYWSHSVPALQGPTFARRIGTTRAISSDSATACQQLNLGGVQCCFFFVPGWNCQQFQLILILKDSRIKGLLPVALCVGAWHEVVCLNVLRYVALWSRRWCC